MGDRVYSRETHTRAVSAHAPKSGPATAHAEQKARETGKLHALVDPAGYGVIRLSLPRFVQQENGLWLLTVGAPLPIETRADTTGSMGGNVDIILRVMPDAFELISEAAPGYDHQVATGIFNDVGDQFVLCRPQFEMEAEKIVPQLTYMVPERAGGDFEEDPDYGLFGGAYLVNSWLNGFGLKGYDFTISDAPGRGIIDERQLVRIFGPEVFEKVKANGHQVSRNPATKRVVKDLLKRAHAFFLQVGVNSGTSAFWADVMGRDRVVFLPSTELTPHVQAVTIGLTEGTLSLMDVVPFLVKHKVEMKYAEQIAQSVAGIPIGAQAALPKYRELPKAGALFREKTDLTPLAPEEIAQIAGAQASGDKGNAGGDLNWL